VTGIILISYTAIRVFTPQKSDVQVSEVLHEINPDSLVNDIDVASLEESASSLGDSEELPDVSKKDIIDYLLFENIEISEIYEQL
jgi:hypothetical protein